MKKRSLLYIDDERQNLVAFKNVFSDEFEVYTALDTKVGYDLVKEHRIKLIVADQRMPGETGVQFLARIRKEFPNTVRTILTGYSDIEAVIDAINQSHIYYFFRKPWDEGRLKMVFRNAFEALELSEANANLARDLTEALETIRVKAQELEEQVEHRQELIEKLDRANRVKSEFLSVISHELRTPLNPIIGYSDLLLKEAGDDEDRSYLEVINRCGNDLLRLIDGILEFLEVERTSVEQAPEAMEIPILLKDLFMLGRSLLGEESPVEIDTILARNGEVCSELPKLMSEWMIVRQIMRNLVSNACKFTEKGEIRITADLLDVDEGLRLKLSVADTGIGIEAENHDQIFEAFTQLDQSLSRKFEGLGLGLALCKRQAALLKGSMGLSSQLGEGSVFTLEIPVEIDGRKEVEASSEFSPPEGLRTIVIDDNENNSRVLATMLEKLSCQNDTAATADEVLALLKKKSYDVVFLDMLMPRVSGCELARRIRSMDIENQPRLVGVTADLGSTTRDDAREAGIERLIYKPLRFEELAEFLSPVAQ